MRVSSLKQIFFVWISWYWCYFSHMSRDSVSPVCGIANKKIHWKEPGILALYSVHQKGLFKQPNITFWRKNSPFCGNFFEIPGRVGKKRFSTNRSYHLILCLSLHLKTIRHQNYHKTKKLGKLVTPYSWLESMLGQELKIRLSRLLGWNIIQEVPSKVYTLWFNSLPLFLWQGCQF